MYASVMHAERAVARQHELIAEAADRRLNRQAQLARRAERATKTRRTVRRTWLRSATQPVQS
jgi:hypothetical protein